MKDAMLKTNESVNNSWQQISSVTDDDDEDDLDVQQNLTEPNQTTINNNNMATRPCSQTVEFSQQQPIIFKHDERIKGVSDALVLTSLSFHIESRSIFAAHLVILKFIIIRKFDKRLGIVFVSIATSTRRRNMSYGSMHFHLNEQLILPNCYNWQLYPSPRPQQAEKRYQYFRMMLSGPIEMT
jgi:hypothetical protein